MWLEIRRGLLRFWRWSTSRWWHAIISAVAALIVLTSVVAIASGGTNSNHDGTTNAAGAVFSPTLIAIRESTSTATPKPTDAPKATNTPKATSTPKETNTPKPTSTPRPPTATPLPSWQEGAALTQETVLAALKSAKKMSRSEDLKKPETLTINADTGTILLDYKATDSLGETDLLTIGAQTAFSADRALFDNPNVQRTVVDIRADWTDQYGKTAEERTTSAELKRATVDQIDWSGLEDRVLLDNKLFFCIADGYYIHPAIYVRLKDKGCLP